MNFANKLIQDLKKQIGTGDKVLVAVSGGSDSMLTSVLMKDFFLANKYPLQNLYFVHFNHKIRKESDQEEQFIKEFLKGHAREGGHLIHIIHKPKNIKFTEQHLRDRRYSEILKITKKHKIKFVALGHNLSDRIESTFMNLLRGASLKGFLSMNFLQTHNLLPGIKVIRPLITLSKPSIIEICKKNHIPFVTDQSNYDTTFSLRNKLRHEILPSLYNLSNSSIGQSTFESSMLKLYTAIEKLNIRKGLVTNNSSLITVSSSPHRKSKFAYQRNIKQKEIGMENIIQLLNDLGMYKGVSSAFLNELHQFLRDNKSGYKYFQGTYFFIAHGKIYIIQAPRNFREKHITGKQKQDGYIQRYPQKTDKYKNKTRNQYCITQKIPLFRRNFILILEKNGKIIKVIKSHFNK